MAASSPWGKIETIQATNLTEIMSEEYARTLQNKEIEQYTEELEKDMTLAMELSIEKPAPPAPVPIPTPLEEKKLKKKLKNLAPIDDLVPPDVLKVIQEDAMKIGDSAYDSDSLIARVLQSQFDHEYNEELRRIEKNKNKESKVSISLDKYRRTEDTEFDSTDDELDDYPDIDKGDWDRFVANEKKLSAMPKCGFAIDKESGEKITKHDPYMSEVRNSCRAMSLLDLEVGDAAAFDMKLSNKVYNQLKTYSKNIKTTKKQDRKFHQTTAEMGVDGRTRLILYKLINNRVLEQVNGIISTGKEAVILHADSCSDYTGNLILPKECAIKIFRTTLNEFKQRDIYIKEDWRFKERFSNQNNREIINMWTEKEMHNLNRMQKAGINCPSIVTLKQHILVMSFIGENGIAAPKLKDVQLTFQQLCEAYDQVVDMMNTMYTVANLIHADLSEYNILWYQDKCWFIDVAQSVEPHHPSALEFLMRDCGNVVNYFTRCGLPVVLSKEELFELITELSADSYNRSVLEQIRIQTRACKLEIEQDSDGCPTDVKLSSYPFDVAWEKSKMDKSANCVPIVIESTDAQNCTSFQQPLDNGEEAAGYSKI